MNPEIQELILELCYLNPEDILDPIKVTLVDLITLLRDLCYYDLYILL